MKVLPLAAVALGVSLSACVTVPNEAPRATMMAAAQLGLSNGSAAIADDHWWSNYGDAQLDRLMRQALANNPTLDQAIARVKQTQAIADVTRAGLSPSASLNANETRQQFSGRDVVPPPYAGTEHWEGREGLNLSWDLDFWGRQSSVLKQARSQALAADLDAAGARLAITGAVVQTYLQLDRSYQLADLAQRSYEQRRQIFEMTQRRVHAGLDTEIELHEAAGAVPLAQVELKQAQMNRDQLIHLLAALTGQGADVYATISHPQLRRDAALTLPQSLPVDLLGRRPDVLAARSRVEGATAGQSAAKAAFYPDVDLVAFAGTSAIGFTNLFRAASGNYGAGPAIHLPLFDAGLLKAQYRGAGAEIDSTVADYNETVLQAVREVSDQLTAIDSQADQLVRQQQALDDAEAAYRLAGERYRAGLTNYLTVLSTETQVLNARRQHVELATAQNVSRATLLLSVGGSFDPHSPLPVPLPATVAAN